MTKEKKESVEKKSPVNKITINKQYIKDLSFESPQAPNIFTIKDFAPKINIQVNVNAKKIQEEVFEVEMCIEVTAEKEEEKVFILELIYAGVFTTQGIEKEDIERVLLVNCPYLLFPFARRILSDITRDAGFVPINLNPIDFQTMFEGRKKK